MTPTIITATLDQIEDLVPLFDAYRVFYQQASNIEQSQAFLRERMYLRESVVFLAYIESRAVGFAQLYPSFSSVTVERLWILNDLYVIADMRGQRIGEKLLHRAAEFVRSFGAKGLSLSTELTNKSGQKLYERVGFERDNEFYHYFLNVELQQKDM